MSRMSRSAIVVCGCLCLAAVAPQIASAYPCGSPLAFDQKDFIHGEYVAWKAQYVRGFDGNTMCVVREKDGVSSNPAYPEDCVSEGIGYGMLLAAYLQDQQTFDGLWNFWQRFQDPQGIMDWQVDPRQMKALGTGGATDADADMALALLKAFENWKGDYGQKALKQIERIWAHEVDPNTFSVRPGDQWGSCSTIDSSYFSPAWYKVFGKVTGKTAEWNKVIDAGFAFLRKCNTRNSGTGLTPSWTNCDCGYAPQSFYPNSDNYWCDAVRVPWRMALSAAWHCDNRALDQTKLLASFFAGQGALNMMHVGGNGGYTITGKLLNSTERFNACSPQCYVTTGSAAFVTGMQNSHAGKEFWTVSAHGVPAQQNCYYCDILRMVSLLFAAGMMPEPRINVIV